METNLRQEGIRKDEKQRFLTEITVRNRNQIGQLALFLMTRLFFLGRLLPCEPRQILPRRLFLSPFPMADAING